MTFTKKLAGFLPLFFFAATAFAQIPEFGTAIYYADYLHGRKTASAEPYDKFQLTTAHKTHPFGTLLKVTRTDNSKSVVVRVNDRGPFNPGCVVDVSWAAADQIGLVLDGRAEVKVEVVGFSNTNPSLEKSQALISSNTTQPAETPASYSYSGFIPSDVPVSYDAPNTQIKSVEAPVVAPATPAGVDYMPAGKTGYGVQIASYGHFPNAERQVNMLKSRGLKEVYIKQTLAADGSTMYKIIVGAYPDRVGAQNSITTLRSQYQLAGFVVNLANL